MGLRATVQLLPIDRPTPAGRIYPRVVAESVVAQARERIESGGFLGTDFATIRDGAEFPKEAAMFRVLAARIESDWIVIDIEFLDTPLGKRAADAHEKHTLCFTPSSIGTVEDDMRVTDTKLCNIVCGLTKRLDPLDAGQSDEASDTEDPALASPE